MNPKHNTSVIFELIRKMRDVDASFKEELIQLSDFQYFWEGTTIRSLLIFKESEYDNIQKCYTNSSHRISCFFIPANFEIQDFQFKDEVYTFFAKDGRIQSGHLHHFQNMFHELPFGGNRVSSSHVEKLFIDCDKETNIEDYDDPKWGKFIFRERLGYSPDDENTFLGYRFYLYIHTHDILKMPLFIEYLNEIVKDFDNYYLTFKEELSKSFPITQEEKDAITIDSIDIFVDGEFDLTYCLPEGEFVEYVRVCFSKDGKPVETTFGNF